jgi:hypothetical protein
MEIKGKVTKLMPIAEISGGKYRKQEVVITTEDQYPKTICLSVWNDNIAKFQLRVGGVYSFRLDIESREYNGKYYTEVKAWSCAHSSSGATSAPPLTPQPATPSPVKDDTDLPF